MKIKFHISTSVYTHPDLTKGIDRKLPTKLEEDSAGNLISFYASGYEDDVHIKEILKFIKKKGYVVKRDEVDSNPKIFHIRSEYEYEKEDLEKAEFLRGFCRKAVNTDGVGSQIVKGQVNLAKEPGKFRYCLSLGSFLISKAVKEKLAAQAFCRILFPTVNIVSKKGTILEKKKDIFSLYSSLTLPEYVIENRQHVYQRKQLKKMGDFDVALNGRCMLSSNINHLVFSQKFYRFWEAHFGDVDWKPVQVKD